MIKQTLFALSLTLATFVVGCISPALNSRVDPTTIEVGAQVVAATGAAYAIQQDTNAVAYFNLALGVLDAALDNGQLSASSLQANLKVISTSSLRSPEAVTFLPIAIQGLQALEGKNIAAGLSTNAYAAAIVTGIDNGLRQALSRPTIAILPLAAIVLPSPAVTNK